MWDTDPEAVSELIDLAVDWCEVDGGKLWLTSKTSTFEIPRATAADTMRRIIRTGIGCRLLSASDKTMQRTVNIGWNGYATFDIAGYAKPGWRECADELTTVLQSAHHLINWGFVVRHTPDVNGISPRTSLVMHDVLWDPYEGTVNHFSKFKQDPRRHPDVVLDVYGIQILGPGHDAARVTGDWNVEPLTRGRSLVTAKDLAPWFADAPSLQTLLNAREDFGDLVDTIWSPYGELSDSIPPDPPPLA